MNIWSQLLCVFLSGGLGAGCRFLVQHWLNPTGIWTALGTLAVNASGCLIMGIFAGILAASDWDASVRTAWSVMLMTGFCGGYTTFSLFALDCIRYFQNGQLGIWTLFAAATILSCIFACALGFWIGKSIIS